MLKASDIEVRVNKNGTSTSPNALQPLKRIKLLSNYLFSYKLSRDQRSSITFSLTERKLKGSCCSKMALLRCFQFSVFRIEFCQCANFSILCVEVLPLSNSASSKISSLLISEFVRISNCNSFCSVSNSAEKCTTLNSIIC